MGNKKIEKKRNIRNIQRWFMGKWSVLAMVAFLFVGVGGLVHAAAESPGGSTYERIREIDIPAVARGSFADLGEGDANTVVNMSRDAKKARFALLFQNVMEVPAGELSYYPAYDVINDIVQTDVARRLDVIKGQAQKRTSADWIDRIADSYGRIQILASTLLAQAQQAPETQAPVKEPAPPSSPKPGGPTPKSAVDVLVVKQFEGGMSSSKKVREIAKEIGDVKEDLKKGALVSFDELLQYAYQQINRLIDVRSQANRDGFQKIINTCNNLLREIIAMLKTKLTNVLKSANTGEELGRAINPNLVTSLFQSLIDDAEDKQEFTRRVLARDNIVLKAYDSFARDIADAYTAFYKRTGVQPQLQPQPQPSLAPQQQPSPELKPSIPALLPPPLSPISAPSAPPSKEPTRVVGAGPGQQPAISQEVIQQYIEPWPPARWEQGQEEEYNELKKKLFAMDKRLEELGREETFLRLKASEDDQQALRAQWTTPANRTDKLLDKVKDPNAKARVKGLSDTFTIDIQREVDNVIAEAA